MRQTFSHFYQERPSDDPEIHPYRLRLEVSDKVAGATQNPGMMDILSVAAATQKSRHGLHQPPKIKRLPFHL
jgi:hypothetical protein